MSRKVLDSNIGDSDIEYIFDNIVAKNPQLNAQIEKVHNESSIFLCEILRIYPYEDKALVKILNNGKTTFCRLSHEVLSEDMNINYLPNGNEDYDNEYFRGKRYIKPFNRIYGIVVKVRWMNYDDENVLISYVNIEDTADLKSRSDKGEVSLQSGESIISIDNERVNIMTPSLFINGLPHDEPELKNYYDKKEVNMIMESIEDSSQIFEKISDAVDSYKKTSDENIYTLFRGDCWTINNNYESSASITSTSEDNFKVTGTFRTKNDMVRVYWYSKDPINHPYISYGERTDYTGVSLEFDYTTNNCLDFTNGLVSITLKKTTGETYYFTMGRFISNGHFSLDFDNLTILKDNQYINSKGNTVTATETTKVSPTNIEYIQFVIVPSNFTTTKLPYVIMKNQDFTCNISNIRVVNGKICNEHVYLKPHSYRLCEGYDDFYKFNPRRICKEMRKLGYTEWCDLYIGASHFYEKSGTINDTITSLEFNHTRTEKMVLDKTKPLNKAFSTWLDCYARELKRNETPNLIISVSMENLQCPTSWRQKQAQPSQTSIVNNPNGYAMTGWIPSTFFYSPCHEDVLPYMQSVSEACLDIVVANGMRPILQLGEAWWWWNEETDPVNRSPCFYDDSTKAKYREEFGKDMPEYIKPTEPFDTKTIEWLNNQIVEYSWGLRKVVKKDKYTKGLYMALFFPPSVVDKDRVPLMMRKVNYLSGIYSPKQLDILQLEDYDWVTGISEQTKERDKSHHHEVYTIGQGLGFTLDKLHYFGGFVMNPEDANEYWKEIKKAMDTALQLGFSEVYVWAGSQVRRDGKMLGYESHELVQKLMK